MHVRVNRARDELRFTSVFSGAVKKGSGSKRVETTFCDAILNTRLQPLKNIKCSALYASILEMEMENLARGGHLFIYQRSRSFLLLRAI